MRYFILVLFVACLGSCQEEPAEEKTTGTPGQSDGKAYKELKKKYDQLQRESEVKDSLFTESVKLYSEIEQNLAQISYEQGRIRMEGMNNIEVQEDPKEWILQEIKKINELRKQNQQKVEQLNGVIANLNNTITNQNAQLEEFQNLVEDLTKNISAKELEIETLKTELQELDEEYSELFEAYVEMANEAEESTDELNTAFYAYGSSKELKKNGVITKEGGFIGIGRIEKLKQDFNKDYFQEINIKQTKEITVRDDKVELITTHPKDAYELIVDEEAETTLLKIKDPKTFWSASKYLVIVVG